MPEICGRSTSVQVVGTAVVCEPALARDEMDEHQAIEERLREQVQFALVREAHDAAFQGRINTLVLGIEPPQSLISR